MTKQDYSQKVQIEIELANVLVLGLPSVFNAYERQFSEKFRLLKPWESSLPLNQYLVTHAGSVQAAFCSARHPINTDILQMLPELHLIVASSTGVDHIDLRECERCGVKVTNAASIFSEDVADTAVGFLIDVLRKVSAADRLLRLACGTRKEIILLVTSWVASELGLLEWEALVLKLQRGLTPLVASSHTPRHKKPDIAFAFCLDINELAANCEILVICCALTNQTRHMIDKNVMLALGKEGIIVNVARGAIINEKDLVQCLLKGEIAGAGLDVFENELTVLAEFLMLDNVIMSPHNAVMTEESFRDVYELTVRNLDAIFSNKSLMFEVV